VIEPRKKRSGGSGTVEPYRGQFRARLPSSKEDGTRKRHTLGVYPTFEMAQGALEVYHGKLGKREGDSAGKVTLRTIGERFLTSRELGGVRGVSIEMDRWNAHVLTSHVADWALTEIESRNVREFRDRLRVKKATKPAPGGTRDNPKRVESNRKLSRSAVKNTLNLLRQAFEWAVEQDLIPANPAYGVKLQKELRTDEPWTYLTPEEQHAIFTCEAIPLPERLIIQFAVGTGMRRGELWCLHREDVHEQGPEPKVYVRYGSPGMPPKSGKPRWVPMTALALDAAKRWLALLSKYVKKGANTKQLMFPTRRGHSRWKRIFRAELRDANGKRTARTMHWADIVRAAGITRRVRFHDLRHTAGSSLVAGWWGTPWPLITVRDFLGHSQVSVTERYAHLAVSALAEAAYRTSLPGPMVAQAPNSAQSKEPS
jgi:integrase